MISEFVKQSKKAAKNLKARPGRLVVVEYDKKERQNFIFDRSSDFSAIKSHSNLITPIIPYYNFDLKKTKKLFFTNLHILGVRKTFEKLEKELNKAFEKSSESKKDITEEGF